jgi:hypothetical protein
VYLCAVILVVLVALAWSCEFYVTRAVNNTIELLEDGELVAAHENWQRLTRFSNFLLVDLTLVPHIAVAFAQEDATSAITLLEHFRSDNQSG